MGKKRVLVGYGVDIDAVAGWLGSYGGEDSVSDISRGRYALSQLPCFSLLTLFYYQVFGQATSELLVS